MLKAKDILTKNGQPVLVTLDDIADNKRFPARQYGFEIELPDKLKEEMREQMRESVMEAGRQFGLDEETIDEHIRERINDAPIAVLADEPFAICWN